MKTLRLLTLLALSGLFLLTGCETKNNPVAVPEIPEISSNTRAGATAAATTTGYLGSGPYSGTQLNCVNGFYEYSYTLWAGQNKNAGSVVITNDDKNFYVTFNTNQSSDLLEVHVNVYKSSDVLPVKRPVPGQAPFKAGNLYSDKYTLTIPFSALGVTSVCGDKYYFVTHAALVADNTSDNSTDEPSSISTAGETAYSGGKTPYTDTKGGGAWFYIAEYKIDCCVEDKCPEMVYTLWAGQHNNAGTITIENDGQFLYIFYNTNESADLGSVHVRIDTTPPTGKDSPGRYNMNKYVNPSGLPSDSYVVVIPLAEVGFSCDQKLYISAHASLVADNPADNATDENVPSDNGGYSPGGSYNLSNAGETAFGGPSTKGDSNFDLSGNTSYGGGTFVAPKGGAWFYFMNYTICCK